jgi:hypothetical protein
MKSIHALLLPVRALFEMALDYTKMDTKEFPSVPDMLKQAISNIMDKISPLSGYIDTMITDPQFQKSAKKTKGSSIDHDDVVDVIVAKITEGLSMVKSLPVEVRSAFIFILLVIEGDIPLSDILLPPEIEKMNQLMSSVLPSIQKIKDIINSGDEKAIKEALHSMIEEIGDEFKNKNQQDTINNARSVIERAKQLINKSEKS